jgi:hypothetical protein
MAIVLADRVRETTTTSGTGTVTLAGAVSGYQSFAAVGNGNTTYYTIADQSGSNWEVGIGTYTSSGTTLSRTTVLASSNSGSLVSFGSNVKDVFVVYPAEKSVNLDANNAVTINAPTSGTALTVSGVTGNNGTIVISAPTDNAQIRFTDSTVAAYLGIGAFATGSWNFGTYSAHSSSWYTNNSQRVSINSSGNVTINAPSSGVALQVNGLSTGVDTLRLSASTNSAQGQMSFYVPAGQVGALIWDNSTTLTGIANSVVFGGAAAAVALQTSSSIRLLVNGSGNVTINAPSSGTALQVNGLAGTTTNSVFAQFQAATGTNFTINSVGSAGSYLTTASVGDVALRAEANNLNIGAASGNTYIATASRSIATFGAGGNVSISAPTSGIAFDVTGVSGAAVAIFRGITTASYIQINRSGSANGYIGSGDSVVSGGSSADFGIVAAASGGLNFGTNGSTSRMTIASGGNVTINAPSSGAALAVTTGTGTNQFGVTVAMAQTGATSGTAFYATRAGSTANSVGLGPNIQLSDTTNSTGVLLQATWSGSGSLGQLEVFQYTNGSWGQSAYWNGNRGLVLNAPSSGAALTVTAATGGTTNAGLTVNGSAATPTSAVTFSATAMTVDCTKSNVFTTTFTANVTTAPTISNPQDGQTLNWFITQDATGSRTMTWPTSFKWPGGTAGVLSTAANAVDLLVATYRSSTGFWYATLSKGFA